MDERETKGERREAKRQMRVIGRSVRPSHRMVGHTGFITTARRCSPLPAPAQEETA